MTDVMEDFKKHHYVIAPPYLTDGRELLIILTSTSFWADNYEELIAWSRDNNCHVEGMTVLAGNDAALTAFCLRW